MQVRISGNFPCTRLWTFSPALIATIFRTAAFCPIIARRERNGEEWPNILRRRPPSTSDWVPKEISVCVTVLRCRVETSIWWPILVSLTRLPLSQRQIALGPRQISPSLPFNTVGVDRRRLVASKNQCRRTRINFAGGRGGRTYYILPHPPVHSYILHSKEKMPNKNKNSSSQKTSASAGTSQQTGQRWVAPVAYRVPNSEQQVLM